MTLETRVLAQGSGWKASEVICRAGPSDPLVEEQHAQVCIAIVAAGTFGYRSSRGTATLAPGAILLGKPGECFACGHEHSVGDRCLAFHFDSSKFDEVVSALPGTREDSLAEPSLPPRPDHTKLLIAAEAAIDDAAALEEVALWLAAMVAGASARANCATALNTLHRRRMEELAHWLEKEFVRPMTLGELARQAGMSPSHLLRQFKYVVGVTPYQFVLGLRLRRAAKLLREGDDSILSVALEAGFQDQSEFNRRFRRFTSATPREFRRGARPRVNDAI